MTKAHRVQIGSSSTQNVLPQFLGHLLRAQCFSVSGSGAAGTSTSNECPPDEAEISAVSMACRTLWVPTGKDSVPTDSGVRSQFCGRAIVNAVLIAIENRVRLSERIGQFMN